MLSNTITFIVAVDEQAPRLAPEKRDLRPPTHLEQLCDRSLITRKVSWLVSQSRSMSVWSVSVSLSHSRPTSLSSTVLCLKISSSSVHIRSYWHKHVCNAFFWKISSIHRLLDQIGCDSVFYLIAKCSRSIAQAVYMSPDLYSDSTYADVFAGSSPRALFAEVTAFTAFGRWSIYI